MWLLNTSTLELCEFLGEVKVPYGILSHRWESTEDEVSHKDHRKQLKDGTPGREKIRNLCRLARNEGLEWAWIDTCCIDKRSSAELSEGINSTFSWYRKAKTCFAYLKDVGPEKTWEESEWWQRGWTLQELLASPHVVFCDQRWHKFGTKAQMAKKIEKIFGIPYDVLTEPGAYMKCCVAQRMSWAAGRRTGIVEDRAYCLLGLFQINMPLLYGEGRKAFQRLQLEILQKYPDESILAWPPTIAGPHHVLATSPDDFEDCKNFILEEQQAYMGEQLDRDPRRENPPRATSWGIEIRANARKLEPRTSIVVGGQDQMFLWAVTLTTAWCGRIQELPCTIVLVRSGPAPYSYQRLECHRFDSGKALRHLKRRYVIRSIESGVLLYLQFDSDLEP